MKTKNEKQHLNKKKNLPTNYEQPKDLKKKSISKKLKHVDKKKEEQELIKKNKKRLIRRGEKAKKWGQKKERKKKEKYQTTINNL